jgi:SAM-dependent methyltransferase
MSSECPTVAKIDGFDAYAPELAQADGHDFYDPTLFKDLAELESNHFWFQSRNELILWALRHYAGLPARFAEIGCGTGFVTRAIELAFPATEIMGTELFVAGLRFASKRCDRSKLVQADARRMPFRNHFDAVGIFDVLEHVEDDSAVLREIWKAPIPGGLLLLTVPQHAWLWSSADKIARHGRRYSARDLARELSGASFQIVRNTSFVRLLLPAMAASRLRGGSEPTDAVTLLRINVLVNRIFRSIMSAEISLIRLGLNFPFGGSRLLVARKTNT